MTEFSVLPSALLCAACASRTVFQPGEMAFKCIASNEMKMITAETYKSPLHISNSSYDLSGRNSFVMI